MHIYSAVYLIFIDFSVKAKLFKVNHADKNIKMSKKTVTEILLSVTVF